MKKNIVLSAAVAVFLSGCDEISKATVDSSMRLQSWQAKNLLGTGDTGVDHCLGRLMCV